MSRDIRGNKRGRRTDATGARAAISGGENAPTPETVAKLRVDIVVRLRDDGRLTPEECEAALEIRRIWEVLGRALFPSSGGLDRMRQPQQATTFDPILRMTAEEERAWRLRYRPWASEMSVEIVAGMIRVSRLQLVLDVVIDNYGFRQVEGWYRLRHGHALVHVRAALKRYCEIAGWRTAPDSPSSERP